MYIDIDPIEYLYYPESSVAQVCLMYFNKGSSLFNCTRF